MQGLRGCGIGWTDGKDCSAPAQIIPKGIATPGLLAPVAVSKYADALPLYRQEKIFERIGVDISRSTMAGWMVMVALGSKPIIDLLYKGLHSGPLINVDETPVRVMKEPGRANTTKSYMWVFRGGPPDKPIILFKYSETRSGEVPREVLAGYSGYCQTDAFSGYDGLEAAHPGIILVGCFAHARRNFVKVIDARGKAAKNNPGSAEVALQYIGQLYKIEKIARQRELIAEEIVVLRPELVPKAVHSLHARTEIQLQHCRQNNPQKTRVDSTQEDTHTQPPLPPPVDWSTLPTGMVFPRDLE